MVSSVSGSTGGLSNWADSVFSKLDTKNQGYIDKTDLASALSATGESEGSGDTSAVDDMFGALDGDSDGKVTRSELTDAMTRLADQLNAQFDASRVNGGTDGTDGTSSTSADYVAAADTDGDGTVSEAEQAAYDKKVASGQAGDGSDTASAEGAGKPQQQRDPMRELAHALNLLKAYAANSGDSDSSATTADTGSSVSVEA
jgi:Ca2+-binding EF-hand superfamily protein